MENTTKNTRIISITLAIWGVIFLITGGILSTIDRTVIKTEYSVKVDNKKVSDLRTKEIKLKDMVLEENNPLSVDPADYIVDADQISENILKALKLDTSMVNINEPGEYKYTIKYNYRISFLYNEMLPYSYIKILYKDRKYPFIRYVLL